MAVFSHRTQTCGQSHSNHLYCCLGSRCAECSESEKGPPYPPKVPEGPGSPGVKTGMCQHSGTTGSHVNPRSSPAEAGAPPCKAVSSSCSREASHHRALRRKEREASFWPDSGVKCHPCQQGGDSFATAHDSAKPAQARWWFWNNVYLWLLYAR